MAARRKPIVVTFRIPALLADPFVRIVLLYRRICYGYPFRRIPLSRGLYAIVDPADFDRLNRHKWHAANDRGCCYARRTVTDPKTKRRVNINMHREIVKNVPNGMVLDHINNNARDNRNANLRLATYAQNQWNARKKRGPTRSKYKGVSWANKKNRYRARIKVNGRRIHLGYFNSQIEAAKARDEAARKYHGDFALLNFPDQ